MFDSLSSYYFRGEVVFQPSLLNEQPESQPEKQPDTLEGEMTREDEDRLILKAFQILERRVEASKKPKESQPSLPDEEPKTYTFEDVAEELNLKSKGFLVQLLVEDKIVYKNSGYWRPFKKYANSGYFTKRKSFKKYNNQEKEVSHLVLTESGRKWVLGKYQNKELSIYNQKS